MTKSALALPMRVVRSLFSLAAQQVSRFTNRKAPAETPDWTTETDTTGPRMTEPIMPSELPIPSYDGMAAADAVNAIKQLTDPDDVALMLAYERANAKRPDVISAAGKSV